MDNRASLLGRISDLVSLAASTLAATRRNGKGAYVPEAEQMS